MKGALPTGAGARLVALGADRFLPGRLATLAGVGVAVVFYGVTVIKVGLLTKENIVNLPKGEKIAHILEKVGLLK